MFSGIIPQKAAVKWIPLRITTSATNIAKNENTELATRPVLWTVDVLKASH
jgi:hypothetical protein